MWCKLMCGRRELQLMSTLSGGQSFRWTYNKETDEWTGIFSKTVWKIKQDNDYLLYKIMGSLLNDIHIQNEHDKTRPKEGTSIEKASKDFFKQLLENYFRLNLNLERYYKQWAVQDKLFKSACEQFYGIRMLNQEPVENLFSFICSQNNHISRISSMVEKLCTHYGEVICEIEGRKYYAFPEVGNLAETKVESELRDLGFGYRAKFIQKSASQILEWGGDTWFQSLQEMKYKDAKQELMKLHGIGPKVADCICLMSLNHLEALPVDTHVYQIAAQNYLPHLRGKKNVTEKMYAEIGDHFRSLFGDLAGWAHTVLFCADLKKFQEKTTEDECNVPKKKRKK
ncbi:hypothetical protein K1T71_011388 [Dendrolimus kikuchii]|uniref:Uncharacterized protein n=1 Tax=Dendrolimus kikuchii TaxID=765133 RepID=A0ACC1CP17_9NEOP|nr:hypothetical protein K1T71_011388 [Dendrolimus kikuchii]